MSQLVTHIPHRMRMGLALILGPVSLAIGISLWWPMMATAEFRYNYVEIQTWYLESLAANFVGIALLRYWVVEWRKSRRQAPDRGEPEPRQPCSNCNHGHLIPVSVALLPPFSVIGYLLIGMVLWQSAAFAPRCFWPGGSGSIFHDRRNADLLYLALMLLVGWFLRLRTTVLICDNCHCRNYPRPPGLDRTPSPEEDDEPTEDE